jgi:hypothetical protein
MNKMKKIGLLMTALVLSFSVIAKENVSDSKQVKKKEVTQHKLMKFAADCEPASASADLDINNVRTKILNGGDMWWDLSSARYEIPKLEDANAVRKNSLFAGAIWIGGEDEGVLKLAAMTYRQSGSDFWPGPLDTITGNTNEGRCDAYDNIYKIEREEMLTWFEEDFPNNNIASIPENMVNWPAQSKDVNPGEVNINQFLAPYFDSNKDNIYDPYAGDYPVLQTECRGVKLTEEKNEPADQPDQMLWFVYNDKGNIHSETQGQAIGLELQTTAFAYKTNDEINNMTFYTTRIINRGSNSLSSTYFGQWVDPDLGNFSDDYVGCDVGLSLGYCYNGDENDEGILGYGLNPPSVGVDFFEGPKRDTTINGKDTQIELGMSRFVYYDNDFTNFGNPQQPIHYYNYLRGLWKNGDPLTFDKANGRTGTEPARYIFPGDTDPDHLGDNWTEAVAGNTPADRRFLQTSGPFTLKPGAVNKITVGVVWAKASSGGASGSLELLKAASRKAQGLFDNCFDILDGPDAPDITYQELDQEVVLMFTNTKKVENYSEEVVINGKVETYHFQGYRLFQLKDGTVGTGDLEDVDKVREVRVWDVNDSIDRLVNFPFDPILSEPLKKLMVEGTNSGLVHSLSLTEDLFATGSNKTLVNHKRYYYLLASYAAMPGHPTEAYLAGRQSIKFNVSPHKPEPRLGGVKVNGGYGSGPEITRLEGMGNGGMELNLTDESIAVILENGFMANPTYKKSSGPIQLKVIDPLRVPQGDFEFTIIETDIPSNVLDRKDGVDPMNTTWILTNKTTGEVVTSETNLSIENEQLIIEETTGNTLKDWGLALTAVQPSQPGNKEDATGGLLSWEVQWEDNSKQWLTAILDQDGGGWNDWIRSGTNGRTESTKDFSIHDYINDDGDQLDQFSTYETIWNGRIAPYKLASRNIDGATGAPPINVQGPAWNGARPTSEFGNLNNVNSIDLVFTADESKWTKVIVFELGEESGLNENGAEKFDMRDHPSLNKDGSYSTTERGRSWFPGYAINVETGERLNICIGEDSYQTANNGNDMKWNPTDMGGTYGIGASYDANGGRHYIYVMGHNTTSRLGAYKGATKYDGGDYYHSILTGANANYRKTTDLNFKIMFQAMWLVPCYMSAGYEMDVNSNGMPVPPTDLEFNIRIAKPYEYFPHADIVGGTNDNNPRYGFTTDAIYTEIAPKYGTEALELIKAVPNPYFAYSEYENNPVENKVKLTALPEKCEVSIYTINGSLVRRIKKDDPSTEITWDLKNDASVPIGSGSYIIHVNGYDLGEKVIKWMGIMRELDLDSF